MRKPMAFPYEGSGEKQTGMTLRDWYAGMAMQGIMASGPHDCKPWEIASDAWRLADAMMAEREKRND